METATQIYKILLYPQYRILSAAEFMDYLPPKGMAFTKSYDNGFSYCASWPIPDAQAFKEQVIELACNSDVKNGIYLDGGAHVMDYHGKKIIRVDVFGARHTYEISNS